MPDFETGEIVGIGARERGLIRATVRIGDEDVAAIGYPAMLGPLEVGHRVVVNTTGVRLRLGTGGFSLILWNLDGPGGVARGPGHVIKLRYTPWQIEVDAVEAQESPHHDTLAEVVSIEGMPVVACCLHSQVAAVAAGIKAAVPSLRVGYAMTDGGALPLAVSDLVATLVHDGLIDVTATCGHAFGGDLEAVNVFSGLTALRVVGQADVTIVSLGPGIVGTETRLGHTGLEQAQSLDAVGALGGAPIATLRISFADERARHRGVSHHSLTALSVAVRDRVTVVVPSLPSPHSAEVYRQLARAGVEDRHELIEADGGPGLELLRSRLPEVTSMGRGIDEVPELFLAGAAAGAVAAVTGSVPTT